MFELWSRQSGNRIGEFKTPQEVLDMVRELAHDYGPQWAEGLAYGTVDENGQPHRIAAGFELLEQAGVASETTHFAF
jgi:hypothetical protein